MKKKIIALLTATILLLAALAGCAADQTTVSPTPAPDVDANEIWTEIESRVGSETLPMFLESNDETLEFYYGIDPSDLEGYAVKVPMMNVMATEIFIARAAEGKIDDIKAAAEARQEALVDVWSQYLPAQYELVQNYKLETSGDYLIFVIAEQADTMIEIWNSFVSK